MDGARTVKLAFTYELIERHWVRASISDGAAETSMGRSGMCLQTPLATFSAP